MRSSTFVSRIGLALVPLTQLFSQVSAQTAPWTIKADCTQGSSETAGGIHTDSLGATWEVRCARLLSGTFYEDEGTNGQGIYACFKACDNRPGCTAFSYRGNNDIPANEAVTGPTAGKGRCSFRTVGGDYDTTTDTRVYASAKLLTPSPNRVCSNSNNQAFTSTGTANNVYDVYCGRDSTVANGRDLRASTMASCMTKCNAASDCTAFSWENEGDIGVPTDGPNQPENGFCHLRTAPVAADSVTVVANTGGRTNGAKSGFRRDFAIKRTTAPNPNPNPGAGPTAAWSPNQACASGGTDPAGGTYTDSAGATWEVRCGRGLDIDASENQGTSTQGIHACWKGCNNRPGCVAFEFQGTVGADPVTGNGLCFYRSGFNAFNTPTAGNTYASARRITGAPRIPCPATNGADFTTTKKAQYGISCGRDSSSVGTGPTNVASMAACLDLCDTNGACTGVSYTYGGAAEPKDGDTNTLGKCWIRSAAGPTANTAATNTDFAVKRRQADGVTAPPASTCTNTPSPPEVTTLSCEGANSGKGLIGEYTDACGVKYEVHCGSDTSPNAASSPPSTSIYDCMLKCDAYTGCQAAVFNGNTCFIKAGFTGLTNGAGGLAALVRYIPLTSNYPAPVTQTGGGCGKPLTDGLVRGGQSVTFTTTQASNGLSRSYKVHIPRYYDINKASPLIFGFHGQYGTAAAIEDQTKLNDWNINPYGIAVYCQGGGAEAGWESNPEYGEGGSKYPEVRDREFIKALVATMQDRFCVDASRIFGIGHSNGGGFLGVVACDPELSSTFKAIAPNAGAFYTSTNEGGDPNTVLTNTPVQAACSPSRNIAILEAHGTSDGTIGYNGGPRRGKTLPTITHWLNSWARRQGLEETSSTTSINARTTLIQWGGRVGQLGRISHLRLQDWVHEYPNGQGASPINLSPYAMDFFYRWTDPNRALTYDPGFDPNAAIPTTTTTTTTTTKTISTDTTTTTTTTTTSTDTPTTTTTTTTSTDTTTTTTTTSTDETTTPPDATPTGDPEEPSGPTTELDCPADDNKIYTSPVYRTEFQVYCFQNYVSTGPITRSRASSLANCIEQCEFERGEECVGVSYVSSGQDGQWCYFKEEGDELLPQSEGAIIFSAGPPDGTAPDDSSSSSTTTTTTTTTGDELPTVTTTTTTTTGDVLPTVTTTTTTTTSPPANPTACVEDVLYTDTAGLKYRLYCNQDTDAVDPDSPGSSVVLPPGSTYQTCAERCAQKTTCEVWQPSGNDGSCFLKRKPQTRKPSNNGYVVGVLEGDKPPVAGYHVCPRDDGKRVTSINGDVYTLRCRAEVVGDGAKYNREVQDFNGCFNECDKAVADGNSGRCTGFQYVGSPYGEGPGECYLKNAATYRVDTGKAANFIGAIRDTDRTPPVITTTTTTTTTTTSDITTTTTTTTSGTGSASDELPPLVTTTTTTTTSGTGSASDVLPPLVTTTTTTSGTSSASGVLPPIDVPSTTGYSAPGDSSTSNTVPIIDSSTASGAQPDPATSTTSMSMGNPTPTAFPYSCPENNGQRVTVPGGQTYILGCGRGGINGIISQRSAQTFNECLQFCSEEPGTINGGCTAVVWFGGDNGIGGGTCQLREGGNQDFDDQSNVRLVTAIDVRFYVGGGMVSPPPGASSSTGGATSEASISSAVPGVSTTVSIYASSIAITTVIDGQTTVLTSVSTSSISMSMPMSPSSSTGFSVGVTSAGPGPSGSASISSTGISVGVTSAGPGPSGSASVSSTGISVGVTSAGPGPSGSASVSSVPVEPSGSVASTSGSVGSSVPGVSTLTSNGGPQPTSAPVSSGSSSSDSAPQPPSSVSPPPGESTFTPTFVSISTSVSEESPLPSCGETDTATGETSVCQDEYGNTYAVTYGKQYVGKVTKRAVTSNVNDCLLLCNAEPNCVGTNYIGDSCELFEEITGTIDVTTGPPAVAATRPPGVSTVYTAPRSSVSAFTTSSIPPVYGTSSTSRGVSVSATGSPGSSPSISMPSMTGASTPINPASTSNVNPTYPGQSSTGSVSRSASSVASVSTPVGFSSFTDGSVSGSASNTVSQSSQYTPPGSRSSSVGGGSQSGMVTSISVTGASVTGPPPYTSSGSSGAPINPVTQSGVSSSGGVSGGPGGSATSPAPTSSTVTPPAETLCPAYNGRNYTDAQGASYTVSCGQTFNGTPFNPAYRRQAEAYNIQSCMAVCNRYTECIAVTTDGSRCQMFSSVSGTSSSPGSTAAYKVSGPTAVNTNVQTVTVCANQRTSYTTVWTTATYTTCPANSVCTASASATPRLAKRD